MGVMGARIWVGYCGGVLGRGVGRKVFGELRGFWFCFLGRVLALVCVLMGM